MYDAGFVFAGRQLHATPNTDLPSQIRRLRRRRASCPTTSSTLGSGGVRLLEQKLTLGGRVLISLEDATSATSTSVPVNFYADALHAGLHAGRLLLELQVRRRISTSASTVDNVLRRGLHAGALSTPARTSPADCFGSTARAATLRHGSDVYLTRRRSSERTLALRVRIGAAMSPYDRMLRRTWQLQGDSFHCRRRFGNRAREHMSMFIAMNRFKVLKGCRARLRASLAHARDASRASCRASSCSIC